MIYFQYDDTYIYTHAHFYLSDINKHVRRLVRWLPAHVILINVKKYT